jgi:hypothetical protein
VRESRSMCLEINKVHICIQSKIVFVTRYGVAKCLCNTLQKRLGMHKSCIKVSTDNTMAGSFCRKRGRGRYPSKCCHGMNTNKKASKKTESEDDAPAETSQPLSSHSSHSSLTSSSVEEEEEPNDEVEILNQVEDSSNEESVEEEPHDEIPETLNMDDELDAFLTERNYPLLTTSVAQRIAVAYVFHNAFGSPEDSDDMPWIERDNIIQKIRNQLNISKHTKLYCVLEDVIACNHKALRILAKDAKAFFHLGGNRLYCLTL